MPEAISRREFAERLALAAAAPYVALDVASPARAPGSAGPAASAAPSAPAAPPAAQAEPSPLARALAEAIRLRYGDRLSGDDLKAITQGIEFRLQGVERLYRVALSNADEPDFVFSVYRSTP